MDWQALKATGNDEFSKGNAAAAAESYSAALRVSDLPSADRATILCNRAACYLKLGDNAKAAADSTACLTLAPDNAKALYRRAAALEGLGDLKAALRDFRDLLRSNPGVGNAAEAVKRLEKALGITSSAPPPQPTRKLQLTEEELKNFLEVQGRSKEAARQRTKAFEQMRAAQRERRHVELTLSQLGVIPTTSAVFRPAGRAFVKSSHAELGAGLQDRLGKLAQRAKACETAAEYLDKQAKEAEEAQAELLRSMQARSASVARQ